ncbi:MAG: CapA family protein [Bacteroidota bacterium]
MKIRPSFFVASIIILSTNLFAQKQSDTITIIGVGDFMPGSNYPTEQFLPIDSGKNIFDGIKNILTNADITFGNLEGCLLNTGGTIKKCQDSTKCYAFRIPIYFSGIIKNAGFNILNLANNHSGDFGNQGRLSTTRTLDSLGIYFAGSNSAPSVIFEKKGLKIGFCAFSPFIGTVDILKTDTIKRIIKTLDSLCDIVIVSMHAGAEGANFTNVTKQTEIFYGEDRGNVYEFAHLAIDCGADIVFGHGPHVTRAIELYKDRLIAYSLGNFCTYKRFNLKGPNGIAPIIKVKTNCKGEFIQAQIFSIKQIGEGIPVIDDTSAVLKQIIELTKNNFPETPLVIDEYGNITKK